MLILSTVVQTEASPYLGSVLCITVPELQQLQLTWRMTHPTGFGTRRHNAVGTSMRAQMQRCTPTEESKHK